MVLTRAITIVAVLAFAACDQSLFDAHGKPGATHDGSIDAVASGDAPPRALDGAIATTCPAPCVGDAAGDFASGSNHWRYLEDHRNHTWVPMATGTGDKIGAVTGNVISSCVDDPMSPACIGLPGALLMSSAGTTTAADSAIELTAQTPQVLSIQLRVLVPAGAGDQTVRLYRSSREDSLVTFIATAGVEVDQQLTVDALAGDRFLLSLVPVSGAPALVGIQLYFSGATAAFPSQCQVAVEFNATATNATTVANACGTSPFTFRNDSHNPTNAQLVAGPFPEEGSAGGIAVNDYFEGVTPISLVGATTVQFWMKVNAIGLDTGYPFSTLDINSPTDFGGLGVAVYKSSDSVVEVLTPTSDTDYVFYDYHWTQDTAWHFVRVVATKTEVDMCFDGTKVGSFALTNGIAPSTFPPYFAKNTNFDPADADYDGDVDDVRVLSTALPCQ